MMKRKIAVNGFNIVEVTAIIIISSLVSAIVVGTLISNNYRTNNGTTYRDLLNDSNVKDFLNVYSEVLSDYYEDVDKSKVIDSAINGMMGYLGDKYSTYMNSDATDSLNNKLAGNYRGIGISIDSNGFILAVGDDTPAKSVGIKEGDKIISINGIDNIDILLPFCDMP